MYKPVNAGCFDDGRDVYSVGPPPQTLPTEGESTSSTIDRSDQDHGDVLGDEGGLFCSAIEAAKRGWPVFPLYGIVELPHGGLRCECTAGADCKHAGKHPRLSKGFKAASTYPPQVKKWWKLWPNSNIGIATGEPFGVVLDLDPRHGSEDAIRALEASYGPLPATRTSRTGSDGRHLIFAYPDGYHITNSKPEVLAALSGIDVRGHGGYIVAPPSRHISGGRYEWLTNPDHPLAELPQWFFVGLERARLVESDLKALNPYGRKALLAECASVRDATHGERNQTLWRASNHLG